jgi:2-methylcitrate dehydratase PrpD
MFDDVEDPGLSFARFALSIDENAIPDRVLTRASYLVLDAIGIALASGRFEFAKRSLSAMTLVGGSGETSVIGMAVRLSPRDAAVMNGILCHGLDYDDTHLEGAVHPTAVVLPAVLSAAALGGSSGAAALDAFVVGVDVAARVGAVAHRLFHRAGFYPTGVAGAFGAAVAAGMLMGLSESEVANAQGIVLSMASGTLEFLEDGAWNKALCAGWAASSGLAAAALAKQGFVGNRRPYTGRHGLYRTLLSYGAEDCDIRKATDGLGARWAVEDVALKPFPTCIYTHSSIEAAIALHSRIVPDDIVSVHVCVPEGVVQYVCEPLDSKKTPRTTNDAQFSLPFVVAAALLRGRMSVSELDHDALEDPDILALSQLVSYSVEEDRSFPGASPGTVRVSMVDGSVLTERVQINLGHPERPMSEMQLKQKFRKNAGAVKSPEEIKYIEEIVLSNGCEKIDKLNDYI